MKFLLLVCAVGAALASVPSHVEQQFMHWTREHGRFYDSLEEQAHRMNHFYTNVLKVSQLNQAESHHKNGAVFKLNKFADWSEAELRGLRGFRMPELSTVGFAVSNVTAKHGFPKSFDWRDKNMVADVQDQGQCGSCWAFSTTSNVESVNAIKSGSIQKLSEQYLVDCDHTCGTYRFENACNSGCNGGLPPNALKFVMTNGQPGEDAYPYQASVGTCDTTHPTVSSITNFELVSTNEDDIAAYVATKAPVSIAVDASDWSFYTNGIMSSDTICKPITGNPATRLDHAVNIVGYGEENGTKYWIIRNSWSANWGENGYCRILRGTGFCGVNLFVSSAIV